MENVTREVARFYVTTAIIHVGLGCATAVTMWTCGMPTPLRWGVVATVFDFIPYAGSATTLLLAILVAFASFDTLSVALGVAGRFVALATLAGQIMTAATLNSQRRSKQPQHLQRFRSFLFGEKIGLKIEVTTVLGNARPETQSCRRMQPPVMPAVQRRLWCAARCAPEIRPHLTC